MQMWRLFWLLLLCLCDSSSSSSSALYSSPDTVLSSSAADKQRHQLLQPFLQPPLFPPSTSSSASLVATGRYECTASDKQSEEVIPHMRGTSLGGWLVLEPWITPSLFYQFLGVTEKFRHLNNSEALKNHVAIDSLTFCKALGPVEANRQLRLHWKTWVTEEQIRSLASKNITHIRIPVPDWLYTPYGPFEGCYDGAVEVLDSVLHWAEKHKLKVLLDIHAVRGSQVS